VLLLEWRQYAHGHALKSIREVVDNVPAICHLHCIGRTACRRTGVHAISIAADHLRARMYGQPVDQGFGGWILEHVDDVVIITVDHNRPVAAPPTKGELVNPEDPWR
jgi:hypothetical protein